MTATTDTTVSQQGNLSVWVGSLANDVAFQKYMSADMELIVNLAGCCRNQPSKWEEHCTSRAEKLMAIHETDKVWNYDDAPELFKSIQPSPSLQWQRNKHGDIGQEGGETTWPSPSLARSSEAPRSMHSTCLQRLRATSHWRSVNRELISFGYFQ